MKRPMHPKDRADRSGKAAQRLAQENKRLRAALAEIESIGANYVPKEQFYLSAPHHDMAAVARAALATSTEPGSPVETTPSNEAGVVP